MHAIDYTTVYLSSLVKPMRTERCGEFLDAGESK